MPLSGQLCALTLFTKVDVAGENRRPATTTSDTSRQTSGSMTGLICKPGMTALNSGMKQIPNPPETMF